MSDPSERVLATWRASAPYWEKHGPVIRRMFAPITQALVEAARVEPGQRVLDVAGGVGEPAFRIAEIVGPRGEVVCTDVVEGMVEAAERASRSLGLANVRFRCCAADALPFEEASFDRTVCRLGAMFFPDPLAALREMLRVTRPGGRVTLAVWSGPERNPMFTTVTEVLARYVPSPPEPADAPGAFRFSAPGVLAAVLRAAGAANVADRVLSFTIEAPLSFDEFWAMRSETSDTLRDKLGQLPPERSKALVDEVHEACRRYFGAGTMRFPAETLVVTGDKH